MNSLKIQQGLNVEVVSANIIKKLYEAALSVPEPLEGELDAAYMSGNLLVDRTYRSQVSYLTTRFHDLHINVTDSYYVPFEDPNVLSVLMANNISSDGIGITEADAATANLGTMFAGNTTITSFDKFGYFTRANTSPANDMFKGCTNLSSVDFSNTTSIADELFSGTALTTLSVPNLQNLSGIDQFSICANLTEVLNLGSITSLPRGTFWHCSLLTDVVLPESCTSIGLAAFAGDSLLLNINLQNVTTIGESAFSGCSSLNTIDLRNVTSINNLAFLNCTGLQGTIDLRNVISIGSAVFAYTNISGILNVPKLQTMSNYVFRNTKISGVECLGKVSGLEGTFRECSNLLYAKIPYECTTLSYDTFLYCNNLTSVEQYTDSIDNWVEGEEPTTGPLSRVTSFGQNCFLNCSLLLLTQLDIQNATTIGNDAFNGTLLSGDIVLPQLSAIGNGAFFGTQITSIDLTGSSISSLPDSVFKNCSSLSKISIPTSVTMLYSYWGEGIPNVLTLEGFDNCVNHALYNWQLFNKTILNPIKTSLNSSPIMLLSSNDITINYNLLYNPSITSIGPGRCLSNYLFYTYFTSRVTGGASRVNIGLLYFRDISSFGALTFYKCNINNLVINNVTPPTLNYSANASDRYYREAVWNNNIFPTGNSDQNNNVVIGTLWVPDSAVATYQADPLYSHLNIKGINTKTNGTDYDLPRYATYAAWKAAEEAAVAQGGHAVTGIIEEYM